jgi:acetyltransferase-like isoleucine patch superfamily enzyme
VSEQTITSKRPALSVALRQLLHLIATDPEAARTRLKRGIGVLRARWLFRNCERGELVNALSHVCVDVRGRVKLGDRVQFWEGMIPQEIICAEGAELTIGALSLFNYGVSLRAHRSIRIGERCMFGSLVHIHDSGRNRLAPIVIEDDVWVAHAAVIEPGVTIGTGSVVGAGAVVTTDVPPWSLAVGNPAKCTPLTGAERDPPNHP